jgi:hypothetical protein
MDSIISGINGKAADKIKAALAKAKDKVKAGVKTLTKVVSVPAKLVAKGALELLLPVAAPTFLYLFIPQDKVSLLPATVQKKRNSQVKVANFIVNGLGMEQSHLMGIVRNGIMKRMNKSPEAILSAQFKGIMGIGFAAVIVTLLPKLIELIKKIGGMIGKKTDDIEGEASNMLPSDSDFLNLAANIKETLTKTLLKKDKEETAPGKTVEAFEDIQQSGSEIIPADGGKTGPRGWC